MKKTLIILAALLALSACDEPWQKTDRNKTYYGGLLGRISEVCIDGVTYLVVNEKGITPKINADHYPYICNARNTDIPQQ
ncbi:hypothetical protein NM948_08300 [Pasteurella multocida]|uniref:Lipoprotein n=1 Tax=Pasteurella multocida TaxID=747 RepID=A0A9X3URP6_PASMD|nr:hypothetical protein [Pasteurella multocida]MDA5623536.1 hypothetical protein [Pasteurella multocida]